MKFIMRERLMKFAHGMSNYEWTHPPLGKVFISLGVRMFGMNRLAGELSVCCLESG